MFITRVYSYDGGPNTIGIGWRVVIAFNELARQRRVATRQGKKVIKERVDSSIPVVSPYNLRVSTIALEEAERGRLDLALDRRLKLRDIITDRWKLARHLPIEVRKVLRKAVKPTRTRNEYMANRSEDLDDVLNEDVEVPAPTPKRRKVAKAKTEAVEEKPRRRKTAEVTPVEDKAPRRKARKAPAGEEVKPAKRASKQESQGDSYLKQPSAGGYKGHRAGSLVEKAHKLFDDKLFPRYENGKMDRPKMAEYLEDKVGIATATARTSVYKWTKQREVEVEAENKLAARKAKREARRAAA